MPRVISCLAVVLGPVLALVALFICRPCIINDHFGDIAVCKEVIDGGICGLSPSASALLCGRTCGWCPHDSSVPAAGSTPSKWKPMARVKSRDLNYSTFVEKFKKTSTPVVIEGWLDEHPEFKAWNLSRLVDACGEQPVHCVQRRVAALEMIIGLVKPHPWAAKALSWYLWFRFRTTLEVEVERAKKKVNLKEFVNQTYSNHVSDVPFATLFDYAASAVTVNDFPAPKLCLPFAKDIAIPHWSMRETLVFDNQISEDRRLVPNIFIEADGARAYPAHQHGHDLSHNFQVILEGQKRVVFWPFEEKDNLYLTKISTENHEEIFLAEGIHHRTDLFPGMARARAFETTLNTGDLMYVPCKGIHVFESLGASLGIRFASHDQMSNQCAQELEDAGSTSQNKLYVDYLKELENVMTPDGESPLSTLAELTHHMRHGSLGVRKRTFH